MAKPSKISSVKRGSTGNVEVDSMKPLKSPTATPSSTGIGIVGSSAAKDNTDGGEVADCNPPSIHAANESSYRSKCQHQTDTLSGAHKSQAAAPAPSSLRRDGITNSNEKHSRRNGSNDPNAHTKAEKPVYPISVDAHHGAANDSVVDHGDPHGDTCINPQASMIDQTLLIDGKVANSIVPGQSRCVTNNDDPKQHGKPRRPKALQYATVVQSHKERQRLQFLMPFFGVAVPAGHYWFQSEEDARLILEAIAKHLNKPKNHISKHDVSPLFLDLFKIACNMYKMRLPFSERPMHLNSAIGQGYAELCTYKSDSCHAFREKTKSTEWQALERSDSTAVYRGTDVAQLRSRYWADVKANSIFGKLLAEHVGHEMNHMTRHIILGVLEASPEFYKLKEPPKTMILVRNSTLTKERDLIRERKVGLSSSQLAETVRELHRQFLQQNDTEIAEFASENEQQDMEYQSVHDYEDGGVQAEDWGAYFGSFETPGSRSRAMRSSAAPFKPSDPPRRTELLAPGSKPRISHALEKKSQIRVSQGHQPVDVGLGRQATHKKRKIENGDVPIQRRYGPLEEGEEGDIVLRRKGG